jgi:NAD(P)-dependent dehydrogenase (short-subunit alcohol dehydrogenase family)
MADTAWNLSGKRILVTGAARGIGEATARALAARGARVALVGLEPERLERIAGEIGGDAFAFECDVTERAEVDAAVAAAAERFGGLDVAIANAGIAIPGFARSMDPAAFEHVIEVNLLGVWRTLHAALPHVLESRGYLLGIASEAALAPFPGAASYGTAKAGVEQLCNSLRLELRHLGVDVGVAYFHFIDTDMVRGTDASPVSGLMRSKAKGVFKKTYPLADAVQAVVEGVEGRAHRVMYPKWLRWMILFRGVVPKLAESQIAATIPEADGVFAAEAERLGATGASQAVGAGGEADAKSHEAHVHAHEHAHEAPTPAAAE